MNYLAERVQTVIPHLKRIGQTRSKQNVEGALKFLGKVVEDCTTQAKKYSQKNYALKVIQAGTDQAKFLELNTRLSEAITPLILGLNAEANVMLEQNLVDSLADKRELMARQAADKQEIMESLSELFEQQKQLLEQKQTEKTKKEQTSKNYQTETLLSEKERDQVIGSQMQSAIATLAENLSLNPEEKQDFLKTEYTKLQQEKRFSDINTDPGQPKPPINSRLLVPFHEITIQQKIADGSFGSIYQGTWCEIPVVVKKVCGQSSKKEDYEQFVREVNIMAQLRNPHVTQLYGACLEPDACLVMEYMEKGSLDKLLEKKTLSIEEQKNLGLDIAKGLLYLHTRDVLHRDIKTANILIDEHGRAKLTDFGLSKTADHKVKTILERSDAIQWMAPETFSMKGIYSAASDIYSYGMVLWSICTGKKPFEDFPQEEIIARIIQGKGETIGNNIPLEFQSIIKGCWSPAEGDRPTLLEITETLKNIKTQKQLSPTELCDQGQVFEQKRYFVSAANSYRLAAEEGFFRAQTNLGTFLLNGTGVNQDPKEAYYWMLQSAKQNHARAQYNVARMLEKGEGVEKNLQEALYWYQESAKQGIAEATKKIQELQKSLMPNQLNSGFQKK